MMDNGDGDPKKERTGGSGERRQRGSGLLRLGDTPLPTVRPTAPLSPLHLYRTPLPRGRERGHEYTTLGRVE